MAAVPLPDGPRLANGTEDEEIPMKTEIPNPHSGGAIMKATPGRARQPGKAEPKAGTSRASKSRKPASDVRPGTGAKVTPVKLLSGGNPQIAKADGDAPVQEYIAAMPGWKRGLGKRLDAIITRTVPDVRKAVKWNSPFYGIEGQGWFLTFHVFTRYVKVAFFSGAMLRPVPPGGTARSKDSRWIDIHEGDELDEAQMATWVRQAAAMPGWVP
jgi:hypothetical protein